MQSITNPVLGSKDKGFNSVVLFSYSDTQIFQECTLNNKGKGKSCFKFEGILTKFVVYV